MNKVLKGLAYVSWTDQNPIANSGVSTLSTDSFNARTESPSHRDIFEIEAGNYLDFYFDGNDGEAGAVSGANKVAIDVLYENSTGLVRNLHSGSRPANGSSFRFYGTHDGSSTGNLRAGTYRLRVKMIKDNVASSFREYRSETQDWYNRVVASGGNVSEYTLAAVDELVSGLKTDNLYSEIRRMNIFAGSNLTAALIPLINSGGFSNFTMDLNVSGGFGAADYLETGVSGGLKGDGVNKTLNLGFVFSNALFNNGQVSVYGNLFEGTGNAGALTNYMLFGARDDTDVTGTIASKRIQLISNISKTAVCKDAILNNAASATNTNNSGTFGMFSWVMRGGNVLWMNWNGSDRASVTGSFTNQAPESSSYLFSSGPFTTSPKSKMLCQTYVISTSMTQVDLGRLYNRVVTFNRRLGRSAGTGSLQLFGDYEIDSDGKIGINSGSIITNYSGALRANMMVQELAFDSYPSGEKFAFGVTGDERFKTYARVSPTQSGLGNEGLSFSLLGSVEYDKTPFALSTGLIEINSICDTRFPSGEFPYAARLEVSGNSNLLSGEKFATFKSDFVKNLVNIHNPGRIDGNPTYTTSTFSGFTNAINFNETVGTVTRAGRGNLATGFTIEAKIRISGTRTGNIGSIVNKWDSLSPRWRLYVSGSQNILSFEIGAARVTGTPLLIDTNYDVAASWDGSFLRLYTGGLLINSGSLSTHATDSETIIRIGADGTSGANPFKGNINAVHISTTGRYVGLSYTPSGRITGDSFSSHLMNFNTEIYKRVNDSVITGFSTVILNPAISYGENNFGIVYNRGEIVVPRFAILNARSQPLTRNIPWKIINNTGLIAQSFSSTGAVHSGSYLILTGDSALFHETGVPWLIETNITSGHNITGVPFKVSSKLLFNSGLILNTSSNNLLVDNSGISVRNLEEGHPFYYYLGFARGSGYVGKSGISRRILNTNSGVEDSVSVNTNSQGFVSDSYSIETGDLNSYTATGSPKSILIYHSGNMSEVQNTWGVSSKWSISKSGFLPVDDEFFVHKFGTGYTGTYLLRNRSQSIYFSGYVYNVRGDLLNSGVYFGCRNAQTAELYSSGNPYTLVGGLFSGPNTQISFPVNAATGARTLVISSRTGESSIFSRTGSSQSNYAETSYNNPQFLVTDVLTVLSRAQKTAVLNLGVSPDALYTIGDNVIYAYAHVTDAANDPISGVSCSFTQIDPSQTVAQGPTIALTDVSGWTPNREIRFDTRAPATTGWYQKASANISGNTGSNSFHVTMVSAFTANKNITIGAGPVIGAPNTVGYPTLTTQGNHARPGDRILIGMVLAENGVVATPDTDTVPSIRLSRFNLTNARLETLQSDCGWRYEGQSGYAEYYFPFKYTIESGRAWLLNFGTLAQGVTTGNGYLTDTADWGSHVIYTMASLNYLGQAFRDDEWFPIVPANPMHPYTSGSLPGEYVTRVFDGVDFAVGFPFR